MAASDPVDIGLGMTLHLGNGVDDPSADRWWIKRKGVEILSVEITQGTALEFQRAILLTLCHEKDRGPVPPSYPVGQPGATPVALPTVDPYAATPLPDWRI